MFTGIVEEVGNLKEIKLLGNYAQLDVEASKILEDVKLGDSIAVNGVCLTVTSFKKNSFTADVMPETLKRSNLGTLKQGDEVNLERALKADGRFDGHIVAGHVDGMGTIVKKRNDGNAVVVYIDCDKTVLDLIVEKGSIAIDGVSLTVVDVDSRGFSVSIIPFTGEETSLLKKPIGKKVNLENDIVGKYIEKRVNKTGKYGLTESFLKQHGF